MSVSLRISVWSMILLASLSLAGSGCARLPETTRVLHDDDRVVIKLETNFDTPAGTYTSPTDISNEQLTALLRGYIVHDESRMPIPTLTGDAPPRKLFREMDLTALAPALREALQKVGFRERVRFELLTPGRNPRYWREVTGGWIRVRDHYLHLHVNYFQVEQPIRKMDAYDRNYPTPWTPDKAYSVDFEPARAYVTDPILNEYAVDLNLFIGTASP